MGLLQNVSRAFWDTLDEFQAGPRKPYKPKHKTKLSRPKWMDLRSRRLPSKSGKSAATQKPKVPKRVHVPKAAVPVKKGKVRYVPLRKIAPKHRVVIVRERAAIAKAEPEPDWSAKVDADDTKLNEAIEEPQHRVERIQSAEVKKNVRKNRAFYDSTISKKRRHMLFMNPGTDKILDAKKALLTNDQLPPWARPFQAELSVDDDEKSAVVNQDLLFEGLIMATKEDKRAAVKTQYFDPKGFSTIAPITDELRKTYANVTKKDVTRILRSLETYQRNFARRKPPAIMGRMVLKNPGILAMDMFFPTKKIAGWEGKYSCLTCMDCWSRFVHVYALPNKKLETVRVAMTDFLNKFASLGFMPRRILADKGTDLSAARHVIERYRKAKDGNKPMVVHSQTAQPINIVEAMNAQVQRRMQVFRTSGLTDDPSVLLEDISDSLNRQPRPERGNLSPLQLLALNDAERKRVNDMADDRADLPEIQGLPRLNVGDAVRILMMTRKQQAQNSIKGFTAKWSREVYTVLKKTAIPRNRSNHRYQVGTHQSYFRHELLKIPRNVDTEAPDMLSHRQVVTTAPDENWSDLEYDSDDSRA